MSLSAESVLPLWSSRPSSSQITLFCLPHAGGGASAYRRFALSLRPDIDLQPVQLPGREDLSHLPAVGDAAELVDMLGAALLPVLEQPFGLFGHSLGAAIAAELAAWFTRAVRPRRPELVVVSARTGDFRAGETSLRDRAGAALDDRALLDGMMRLGGTARAVIEDEQVRALVLRTLRHDMHMAGTYRPSFDRLDVPVLALGGAEDDSVSVAELEAWRNRTSKRFQMHHLPGDHFYLYRQSREISQAIFRELAAEPDKMAAEDMDVFARPAGGTPGFTER